MMQRLVLFDIDGTLVNTLGAGRAALVTAMSDVYGETGAIDGFDFHGRTDPAIVRGLLRTVGRSDDWIELGFPSLWPRYYVELERELAARNGRVMALDGVRELLDQLAADSRFASGLVTGNMERGAWLKLGACGISDYFAFGAFGSDSEHREDLPPVARHRAETRLGRRFQMEDAVVVGDTPEDIRCARANDVRVVAVATGRHGVEELEAHAPDATVPDLADTAHLLALLRDA